MASKITLGAARMARRCLMACTSVFLDHVQTGSGFISRIRTEPHTMDLWPAGAVLVNILPSQQPYLCSTIMRTALYLPAAACTE